MTITVISGKNWTRLPKKGTCLEASNDGETWIKAYFVHLDGNLDKPFLCVSSYKSIDYPATKGEHWAILKVLEYEVDDLILEGKKFKTVDGYYVTNVEGLANQSYWDRTPLGEKNGAEFIWNHKGYDYVYAEAENVEKAVKILNRLK